MASDELNAVYDFRGGIVEVVDNDDFVVGLKKGERRERANVAGSTKQTVSQQLILVFCLGSTQKMVLSFDDFVLRQGLTQ